MKLFFVTLFAFLFLACSATSGGSYFYNEIVIRNNSSTNVSNVAIKVESSGMVYNCSFIPLRADCSNKFPKRKYLGHADMEGQGGDNE